jgi:hypothetical protein
MLELPFMKSLQIALGSGRGIRLWRQNVLKVPIYDEAGNLKRYVSAGPPVGCPDLVGIVGPDGWLLGIELKVEGRKRSKDQVSWANMIVAQGGIYCLCAAEKGETMQAAVARCVAEVESAILDKRRERKAFYEVISASIANI